MSVLSNRAPRTRESSDAYVRAVEELVGSRDPLEVLRSTPGELATAMTASPRPVWKQPEAPGKWSLGDVVHHLADTELVWGWRLRRILTEERPTLDGFDQDEWATRLGYGEADPAESLDLFSALRRANLRLGLRATSEDLKRSVLHRERGELQLADLIRHWAGHDILHLAQIQRIRRVVTLDPDR